MTVAGTTVGGKSPLGVGLGVAMATGLIGASCKEEDGSRDDEIRREVVGGCAMEDVVGGCAMEEVVGTSSSWDEDKGGWTSVVMATVVVTCEVEVGRERRGEEEGEGDGSSSSFPDGRR